jgi:hypothetical protein
MKNWLIRTNKDQIVGPVSREKVLELRDNGTLKEVDEICPGNGYWFQIRERDHVEAYLEKELGQPFNPIAEARDVLTENIPQKCISIIESELEDDVSEEDDLIEDDDDDRHNYPQGKDLEFPEVKISKNEIEDVTVVGQSVSGIESSEDATVVGKVRPPEMENEEITEFVETEEDITVVGTVSKHMEANEPVDGTLLETGDATVDVGTLLKMERKEKIIPVSQNSTHVESNKVTKIDKRNEKLIALAIILLIIGVAGYFAFKNQLAIKKLLGALEPIPAVYSQENDIKIKKKNGFKV